LEYRFIISVVVGVLLSFVSIGIFTMWESIKQLNRIFRSSLLRGLAIYLGYNFNFDIISFFIIGNLDIFAFLAPALLAWIFVGYITSSIARGLRDGLITGTLVYVIMILFWIFIAIVAGEDLMAFFQGNQLIATIGGLLGSLIAVAIGSAIGGYVAGPGEEF
jgi:hypothetical protein